MDSHGSKEHSVQPQNFGFQTRAGAPFASTNIMSEADFERANTDVEDEVESSDYYEEEVTDEEAMAAAAKARGEDGDTDDSDMGFYMPTVLAKTGSA